MYTANKGQEHYSLTVADYREAPRLLDEKAKATCQPGDERSCGLTLAGRGYWKEDMAGAPLWAAYNMLQRNAKLTHLAFAWQDLIAGEEIQLLNADQSRTFAFVAMHRDRLYILEGTVPRATRRRCCFSSRWDTSTRTATGCATRQSTRTCRPNIPMRSRHGHR